MCVREQSLLARSTYSRPTALDIIKYSLSFLFIYTRFLVRIVYTYTYSPQQRQQQQQAEVEAGADEEKERMRVGEVKFYRNFLFRFLCFQQCERCWKFSHVEELFERIC